MTLTIVTAAIWGAIINRIAGGMFPLPKWVSWLPEVVFTAAYGVIVYFYCVDVSWIISNLSFKLNILFLETILQALAKWSFAALAWGWAYIWLQTGHAAFYGMGFRRPVYRKNTLSIIVDRLAEPNTKLHGFIGMGLKGMLITLIPGYAIGSLAVALSGLSMAVCYYVAQRWLHKRFDLEGAGWGEILTGAALWAILWAAIYA